MSENNTLSGTVVKLFYQNDEFCAGLLKTPEGFKRFAGKVYVKVNEIVKLVGEWADDPKYGRQFRTDERDYDITIDVDGLADWLAAHEMAAGIGPAKAFRIAEEYGEYFGEVLSDDPERIADFSGVSLDKIQVLRDSWLENKTKNALGTKLAAYKISSGHINKIFRHFKQRSVEIVENDPYELTQISGIGFKTADDIAKKTGISSTDPKRLAGALQFILREAVRDGSTCQDADALAGSAMEMLQVSEEELFEIQLERLCVEKKIVSVTAGGKTWYTSADHHECETEIAGFLDACNEPNPHVHDIDVPAFVDRNCDWLDESQKRAVVSCLTHRGTLITGGAGSGKTTTIKALYHCYDVLVLRHELKTRIKRTKQLIKESADDLRATEEKLKETPRIIEKALSLAKQVEQLESMKNETMSEDWYEKYYTSVTRRVVYLFKSRVTKRYKIGMSEKVLNRARDLELAPKDIELLIVVPTEDARALEAKLHKVFRHKNRYDPHQTDEWFDLDDEDIREFKRLTDHHVVVADYREALTWIENIDEQIQEISDKAEKYKKLPEHLWARKDSLRKMLEMQRADLKKLEDIQKREVDVPLSAGAFNISLCAPTGKAARRMSEVIDGGHAQTIHRLLDYKPDKNPKNNDKFEWFFHYDEDHPLPCQVVIVDEFSMVDVELARSFFRAIKKDTAVVLVGDHHQLPAVGAGAILRDAIDHNLLPVCMLEHCHRQAGTLHKNCEQVLHGKVPATCKDEKPCPWFVVDNLKNPSDIVSMLEKLFTVHLPKMNFDPLTQVQLMTPIHAGALGTRELNLLLQRIHQGKLGVRVPTPGPNRKPPFYQHDKVIHVRNNYQLAVMNGTVGTVLSLDPLLVRMNDRVVDYSPSDQIKKKQEHDRMRRQSGDPFAPAEDEDEEVADDQHSDNPSKEPWLRNPRLDLELGYALTPHKFQGSEVDCAIVICSNKHSRMTHRNWIYTALTRARKTAILLGDSWAIANAVETIKVNDRKTLLPLLAKINQ